MGLKSQSPLTIIVSIVLLGFNHFAIFSAAGGGGRVPDGWQRIERLKLRWVEEVGVYAVAERNRQTGSRLIFQGVVDGATKVEDIEAKIWLIIFAKDCGGSHRYEVVVLQDRLRPNERSLASFKKIQLN
ncbi:hypothetical protein Pfo_018605 [Paulownia fortunei]|nr:hypothetical protein Pfo_018605 [Paulownia fortunei]